MPDGCNLVAAAEIRFGEVARRSREALSDAVALRNPLCHFQHVRPIRRANPNLRRLFCQSNAPNARARTNVQHAHRTCRFRNPEMLTKLARSSEAQWKKRLNELLEKFRSSGLRVYLRCRLAGSHNFRKLQPARKQIIAHMRKKCSVVTRLGRNQERRALWRERIALAVAAQQVERDE